MMRRVLMMIVAGVFALGLAGRADAQTVTMTAVLSGAEETPAPGILTGSFGSAKVTLDMATGTVSWEIDIWNLPSGINNAHFHVGGRGIAGPTVVNIPFAANQSNDFRLTGSANSASALRPDQGIRSWEDFLQSLVAGQVYINIHSVVNGGGEIRGQVVRVP
jgi:hypothetical protein